MRVMLLRVDGVILLARTAVELAKTKRRGWEGLVGVGYMLFWFLLLALPVLTDMLPLITGMLEVLLLPTLPFFFSPCIICLHHEVPILVMVLLVLLLLAPGWILIRPVILILKLRN